MGESEGFFGKLRTECFVFIVNRASINSGTFNSLSCKNYENINFIVMKNENLFLIETFYRIITDSFLE